MRQRRAYIRASSAAGGARGHRRVDEQLRALLAHVRTGFAQLDAGEIDPFELDDLIHHYKRLARELWKFCGSSGSEWERAARTLAFLRDSGEEPDWWQAGTPRARR